ncbi:hypothetical protein [Acidiferrobacter sp. SPIII_3]|uniref:hypothetical protein n=1 Tax=Acidiferrobacter sp. SPIII_3 TaxID=1281578 RepID=UPI0011AB64AA|nr:hypothetical protein [Acidiferrobacter sp. SPIII_3]
MATLLCRVGTAEMDREPLGYSNRRMDGLAQRGGCHTYILTRWLARGTCGGQRTDNIDCRALGVKKPFRLIPERRPGGGQIVIVAALH